MTDDEDDMPRKLIELTDEQRGEIETLAALLNQEQIADYLGVARSTFQAILERDPDVFGRYKKGKARAIAHVARSLIQKARDGDNVAAIFYLKTQAGWHETVNQVVAGKDGAPPIKVETTIDIRGMSQEMRDALRAFAEAAASAAKPGNPLGE